MTECHSTHNVSIWPSEKWADYLWTFFSPQINSGKPVYFSVDRSLLREIVQIEEPLRDDDPLYHLAESCKELFFIKNSFAHLYRERIYTKSDHHSAAICLIALQVCAAELMSSDESFSDQAYFPRLRELMGFPPTYNLNSNPFYKNSLEELWGFFKAEILQLPGSNSRSITFQKGTGRNLFRELPFSQMLLTGEELSRLYNTCLDEMSSYTDDPRKAFVFIHYKRKILSERSRLMVELSTADERRATRFGYQLMDFLENPKAAYHRHLSPTNQQKGKLVGYMSDGFFGDQTCNLYLLSEDGKLLDSLLQKRIANSCSNGKCLLLVESNGVFENVASHNFQPDDEFILVCSIKDESRFARIFSSDRDEASLERIENEVLEGFIALYGFINGHRAYEYVFQSGVFHVPNKVLGKMRAKGGLIIDSRKNEYLYPFSPSHFFYDDQPIPDTETVVFNGLSSSLLEFKNHLNNLPANASHHFILEYKDSVFKFDLLKGDSTTIRRLGFPISNNHIEPNLKLLESKDDALIGCLISRSIDRKSKLKRKKKEDFAALNLLCSHLPTQGIPISDADISTTLSLMDEYKFPLPLIDKVGNNLRQCQLMPANVWMTLFT